jgi:hypothetical protein
LSQLKKKKKKKGKKRTQSKTTLFGIRYDKRGLRNEKKIKNLTNVGKKIHI